jgi:DNA topoisomerase-1
MSKNYFTTTTLVIVESPAKCKTIEKYLGPGYKCIASYGHIRELSSLDNINIQNNFQPTYTVVNNNIKKKQVEVLRNAIKNADDIILACDADREGEAIAYHIQDYFHLPSNTKRITFNEVTESSLKEAIKNPRTIDMNLVHAQQSRQILDLLVGYKISPILWKYISKHSEKSLSAGRCQTPALKLIYENQEEINHSEERKIYNTSGFFTNLNILFELNKNYETEDDIIHFLDGSIIFSHIFTSSAPKKVFKQSPQPFTTSRIQQVASNDYRYSPKETMKICQTLYEGGYITYMRTDSKTYSKEFINSMKKYITSTYEEKYISENIDDLINGCIKEKKTINNEKNKTVLAQEAHEAIRPTNISLYELPKEMTSKEKNIYKLIWENTLESCMANASYYSITSNISSFQDNKFTYTCEQIDFPGWKIVSKKYSLDNKEYNYLLTMKQNTILPYKKIISKVGLKGQKQHYTEARLVQLLEEKGIGRPSTFSSLVDKIQERGYVKKEDIKGKEIVCHDYELVKEEICEIELKREFGNEKGKLVIQPVGIIVMDFLNKYFTEIFNYDYTCNMETSLDKISKGDLLWFELCNICNNELDFFINKIDENKKKIEYKIDDNNTYLIGKYGPVIKTVENKNGKKETTFNPVKKDIDIHKMEAGEYSIEELIETNKANKSSNLNVNDYILGKYMDIDVILKKGKFGLYLSWDNKTFSLKEFGNRPIENISLQEVQKYLTEEKKVIREINKDLSIRKGPKGDYLFYKNSKMKKPQFLELKNFLSEVKEDYKICDIYVLKTWIKNKYNILYEE